MVLEIGREALWLAVMLSGQFLVRLWRWVWHRRYSGCNSNTGNDTELYPKLGAVAAVIFLVGPWMLRLIVTFTQRLFLEIPGLVG